MSGYVARMQTHIHKPAMVLSASRRSDMRITARDLADSIQIIESLEQSISPITRSIDSTSVMQVAQEITSIVHAKGRIRRSELYQMFFHRLTAKEFSELLESAIAAGEIYQATSGITVWVCSCRAPAFGGQTSDSASAGKAKLLELPVLYPLKNGLFEPRRSGIGTPLGPSSGTAFTSFIASAMAFLSRASTANAYSAMSLSFQAM